MQTTPAPAQQPNPNKALWEKGDFTKLAETMRESGEALIAGLGITKVMRILDLGCGDGTTAIPAARTGAHVLGVDIAANLVQAGNLRAKHENLSNITFQEGDACDLKSVPSQQFDLLVSIFGAMFAPRPMDVAREMVRVVKPGGRIVMGNWIPGDPTMVAQILRISSSYSPPPPAGFVSPMLWGVEANVTERFGAAGISPDKIRCTKETYAFNFNGPPAEFVDRFRYFYGPTMNAFDAASKDGKQEQLAAELRELITSQNTSTEPTRTKVPATYLRVVVTV